MSYNKNGRLVPSTPTTISRNPPGRERGREIPNGKLTSPPRLSVHLKTNFILRLINHNTLPTISTRVVIR